MRACRILGENFGEVRMFVVKIKPKRSKATKPNERKATKNSVPKEGLLLLPSQQLQLVLLLLLLLLLLPEEGGGAGGQGWWGVQKGILRVVAFISHFWHFFSLVGWINWISVLSEVWKGAEKRGVGWLVVRGIIYLPIPPRHVQCVLSTNLQQFFLEKQRGDG